MRPSHRRVSGALRRAALGLALCGATALGARGDEPAAPSVSARLLGAVPADGAIAIEPRDDSDENLKLRDLMVAHLTERHGKVAADAPLLLRFSSSVVSDRDAAAAAARNSGGGRGGGGRGLTGMLMSGARNAAGPSGPPAHAGAGIHYKISATLEQRGSGQVLWQAEVIATPSQANDRSIPGQLAAAVIDHLGRTIDTRKPAEPGAPGTAGR
jgi:hypothetical protein